MTARIMIVEDEAQLARAMQINLRAHGYQAMTVGTGAEALEAAANHKLDIVVLDLGLPDMDGVDVILDAIGGEVFDRGLELLAPLGRMITYGAIGGTLPTIPASSLFGLKSVMGVTPAHDSTPTNSKIDFCEASSPRVRTLRSLQSPRARLSAAALPAPSSAPGAPG